MSQVQPPSLRQTSRMSSRVAQRKSVNWARPLATLSTQTKPMKRVTTRLSGRAFASSTDHASNGLDVVPDRKFKPGVVQSSAEEKSIRFVAYNRTRRGARKLEAQAPAAAAAAGTEPPKESTPTSPSSDQKGSTSKMQKRAHTTIQGGQDGDLVAGECNGKEWVSVPLDKVQRKGSDTASKNRDHGTSVLDKSSIDRSSICTRLPQNQEAKSTETDRNIGFCSLNGAWHEHKVELSKKKLEEDTHDASYKELCESLALQKRTVHDLEHNIHEMREIQLKKLCKEKAQIKAMATLEQEKLRGKIAQLSLKTSRILEEKLAIERDRNYIQNDFSAKLERTRQSLRLEIDEEHTEIVSALRNELGKEQEKTCCQICYSSPRDVVILPCMHFHYCNECLREHQRRLKGCPTCRTKINGVLCCNICTG